MPANVIPHRGFQQIPTLGVWYCHTLAMRPRDVLAENLKKLMAASSGLGTFPQITKAGGGSNGTLDRIRRRTTATSVDNLEPLARAYGVAPWQLLVPTLIAEPGGDGKPAIAGMPDWPFSRVSLARYLALSEADRAYVEGKLVSAIEEAESHRPAPRKDVLDAHSRRIDPHQQIVKKKRG